MQFKAYLNLPNPHSDDFVYDIGFQINALHNTYFNEKIITNVTC